MLFTLQTLFLFSFTFLLCTLHGSILAHTCVTLIVELLGVVVSCSFVFTHCNKIERVPS